MCCGSFSVSSFVVCVGVDSNLYILRCKEILFHDMSKKRPIVQA